MKTRPYLVDDGDVQRLIRAPNASQALRYVVKDKYKVKPANTDDVERILTDGGQVESIEIATPSEQTQP